MPLSEIISKCRQNEMRQIACNSFETPIGKAFGAADDDNLYTLIFENSENLEKSFKTLCDKLSCGLVEKKNKILKQVEKELGEYFNGNRTKFTITIKYFGSDFQQSVWKCLQEIPHGSTLTYGDLAKALGREASHARAIGAACGANPLIIVVPCHRVVATGSKGGFTGGVDRKEWLLQHEQKHLKTS